MRCRRALGAGAYRWRRRGSDAEELRAPAPSAAPLSGGQPRDAAAARVSSKRRERLLGCRPTAERLSPLACSVLAAADPAVPARFDPARVADAERRNAKRCGRRPGRRDAASSRVWRDAGPAVVAEHDRGGATGRVEQGFGSPSIAPAEFLRRSLAAVIAGADSGIGWNRFQHRPPPRSARRGRHRDRTSGEGTGVTVDVSVQADPDRLYSVVREGAGRMTFSLPTLGGAHHTSGSSA